MSHQPWTATRPAPEVASRLLTQTFAWMFAGLLLTAAIAFFVSQNETVINTVGEYWLLVFFGQLGLAVVIQAGMSRLSPTLALGLFFAFAASFGFTIGVIVSFYTGESVATAFFSAGAMFGAAAIYGVTTKRRLDSIGNYLFMGMIGVFVASIVNIWLGSSPLGWIIALVGVIVFTVWTAYDVQQISYGNYVTQLGSEEKAAVLGAVHLYISFVNIFLFLLRLLGSRE